MNCATGDQVGRNWNTRERRNVVPASPTSWTKVLPIKDILVLVSMVMPTGWVWIYQEGYFSLASYCSSVQKQHQQPSEMRHHYGWFPGSIICWIPSLKRSWRKPCNTCLPGNMVMINSFCNSEQSMWGIITMPEHRWSCETDLLTWWV